MEKQTIKFSISQDGSVTEEVIGVTGTQCLDLTEKIEEQLGTERCHISARSRHKLKRNQN